MKSVMAVLVLATSWGSLAQPYFAATWALAPEAWTALPNRAPLVGIPVARFTPEIGGLAFSGVENEGELLGQNAYLYLDGDFFLLGIREGEWTTTLRGSRDSAELVILGPGAPEALSSLAILEALGLLPAEGLIALSQKEVPRKPPAPPKGVKLDPVLWALVSHPDWLGFAQAQGLERIGIRVRVVAELSAPLAAAWEPYIRSSTEKLAELLLPIPLLPVLGQDPAVKLVRPPYTPVPAGGRP